MEEVRLAVLDNIMEGVHKANEDHEEISAVLNYYNPEGSTIHVYRPTNKPVYLINGSKNSNRIWSMAFRL